MTDTWFYSLIPATVIAILAIMARVLSRSWTHPATLFSSFWALHALLVQLLIPELPVYPSGLWFIAVACLAVQAGAFITAPPSRARASYLAKARMRQDLQSKLLRSMIVSVAYLLPVGFISAYFTLEAGHRSLDNLTSMKKLAIMATANTVFRYSAKYYSPNLIVQFFSSAIYLLPIFGGIIIALRRNRWHTLIAFGTFLPAIFVTATQTTKAAVLASLMFWIGSYLACTEYTGGRPSGRRVVSLALMIGILLASVFGAAESLRSGMAPTPDNILRSAGTGRARTTAFGHMFVFTQWFDDAFQEPPPPTYGSYTFAGPADLLGLSTKASGVYKEASQLQVFKTTSNIYTYFRGLIEDFTIVGALVFLFALGLVAGWAYHGSREFRIERMPWIMLYNAWVLWFVVSIFTYNSLILALVLFFGYWRLATRSRRVEPTRATETTPCPV